MKWAPEEKDTMDRSEVVVWLGEPACHDPRNTGGKAAALSRLAERFDVPHGFCITSTALAEIAPPVRLPNRLRNGVLNAYRALLATDSPVAVRSSAVDEDGSLTSFAGVHETFLNVHGNDAVLAAIERCLESFFSPRALSYRHERGAAHGAFEDVRMSVLVQRQIASDVSIVAFSANPVTSRQDEIVVTASWGLGESVVGGTVTPDTWIVDHTGEFLREERIGDKRRMTVATEGGSREVDVPRVLRNVPSLAWEQVSDVARLAARLERQTGYPVDIECAYADSRLYLLQCRPITTLSPTRDPAGPSPTARL
jgi:phosphoenolpyruvate synthase/pyruvate phosphate dikinase